MGKRLIIPGADFSANAIENEPIPVPVDFTLQNGYSSIPTNGQWIDIDSTASAVLIRVRTNQLYGSYSVKTKSGYAIRGISVYKPEQTSFTPGTHAIDEGEQLISAQGLTEYSLSADGYYSIITFCKTDATQSISASEDIVDYIIRPLE